MKGLELSKEYYETCFKDIFFSEFGQLSDKVAIGLCGSGSECYGYDDDISKDHDYEPGFCVFIPGEDVVDRKTAFQLQRAYDKMPREFGGLSRSLVSPVGGKRHGVIRIEEFVTEKLGSFPFTDTQWLMTPSYSISEAVNGQIWYDGRGEISAIREYLNRMPEDIRLKRLAGQLILMAQSGQYNAERCMEHGETAASQLAINEFVKACLEAVFLLNRAYMPFYKWSFRALKALPVLSELSEPLEYLLMGDSKDRNGKLFSIGEVCHAVQDELRKQDISSMECDDMEKHAYSVNDHIKDNSIRIMNIFTAV